ncbi:TPA: hypothetical protein MIQ36_19375 [Klebsiella pneumoniae]|nr:hypothetical protein [Klebsiella pneumoniae]
MLPLCCHFEAIDSSLISDKFNECRLFKFGMMIIFRLIEQNMIFREWVIFYNIKYIICNFTSIKSFQEPFIEGIIAIISFKCKLFMCRACCNIC